jgi:hypothetical protein
VVETAYCIGLTNNKDGFTTLLALVAPVATIAPDKSALVRA